MAAHTGMPSFRLQGAGRLVVVNGGRRVATVGADGDVFVSDPGAEIGVNVSYSFAGSTVALRRSNPFGDGFLLTDSRGRGAVNVKVLGHDSQGSDVGVSFFEGDSQFPVVEYEWAAPSYTGSLELLSGPGDTTKMRNLMQAREPLWIVHNRTTCQIEGCDFGASRLVQPTRWSAQRSPRVDAAWRQWSIEYRLLRRSTVVDSPVVSWGDWAVTGSGWEAKSVVQLARQIAGMP